MPGLCYVTPKRIEIYGLENIRKHRDALRRIAKSVEKFLALSDDPAFFVDITVPGSGQLLLGQSASAPTRVRHLGRVMTKDHERAVKKIQDAINELFGVQPKLSVPEAKKIMTQLMQDIDIILINIDWMQTNFAEFRDKH